MNDDYRVPNASILRRPLFFVHVPKTAGTSVRSIVEYLYPSEQTLRVTDPEEYTRKGFPETARFVSGHIPAYFRKYFSETPKIMTLLRDPIERIVSAYRYWRSLELPAEIHGGWEPVALAHRLSLQEFLVYDAPPLRGELGNFHCFWIGKIDDSPHWTYQQLLVTAKEIIANAFWFGVVERLEESLALLTHALALPPQWHEGRLNASPRVNYAADIPKKVLDIARSRNGLDYELYDFACKLLDERKKTMVACRASWQEPREAEVPPNETRARSFSMKEGLVGSGWWAREGGGDFFWRFAFRKWPATLWFWWPIVGNSYAALWFPYIQNDVRWESIHIKINDVQLRPIFVECKIGKIAIVHISRELMSLEKLVPIAIYSCDWIGPPKEGQVGDSEEVYDHSSQTLVSLNSIRWFEIDGDGHDLPGELERFLRSVGVPDGGVADLKSALESKSLAV